MTKVTLDMVAFKALASDTRLDILKTLDGKKMALKDISKATKLNKATLHEHLSKLNDAGLVKKNEREGHKWVYYKLTWKGECLLHPENTHIVVMFSLAFFALCAGIMNLVSYAKGAVVGRAVNFICSDSTALYALSPSFSQAPIANVPLTNQTSEQLSQALVANSELKGAIGNTIAYHDIDWAIEEGARGLDIDSYHYLAEKALNGASDGITSYGADAPSSMIAIARDPSLQYIAIVCLVIFSVLICFSAWRLWKSRAQKL